MKRAKQTSESLELGMILALSGGFMDAYSYICRGKVFANAQTGNMLLLGIYISEGQFSFIPKYLIPIVAFALGIALADLMKSHQTNRIHWRQILVFIEAFVFIGVGFLPQSMNLLANSLTSFVCGIQVEAFRKIHNHPIATTMCIGNLRSAIENLYHFFTHHQFEHLETCFIYLMTILCFIIGAIIGNICVIHFNELAILGSAFLLFISFMMMFVDRDIS